jgi:hypothetical protein
MAGSRHAAEESRGLGYVGQVGDIGRGRTVIAGAAPTDQARAGPEGIQQLGGRRVEGDDAARRAAEVNIRPGIVLEADRRGRAPR